MKKGDDLKSRVANKRVANKLKNMPGAFKPPKAPKAVQATPTKQSTAVDTS